MIDIHLYILAIKDFVPHILAICQPNRPVVVVLGYRPGLLTLRNRYQI